MPVDSRIEIHQQMKNTLLWKLLFNVFQEKNANDYVNARLKNPDSLLNTVLDLEGIG